MPPAASRNAQLPLAQGGESRTGRISAKQTRKMAGRLKLLVDGKSCHVITCAARQGSGGHRQEIQLTMRAIGVDVGVDVLPSNSRDCP